MIVQLIDSHKTYFYPFYIHYSRLIIAEMNNSLASRASMVS